MVWLIKRANRKSIRLTSGSSHPAVDHLRAVSVMFADYNGTNTLVSDCNPHPHRVHSQGSQRQYPGRDASRRPPIELLTTDLVVYAT